MSATLTQNQAKAAVMLLMTVRDAIKEAGSIPSGTLYAMLNAHGMSLPAYERIIALLIEAGVVRRDKSHMLHWIG